MSNLLCNLLCGSRLYGLATADSDFDFKSVFIPDKRAILLGRSPQTIKTKDEAANSETESFSLYHFVKLACEGQTIPLEMLWAPREFYQGGSHPIWDELVLRRHSFLSRNIKSFVGYARAQASKYSLKGERLNKLRAFYDTVHAAAGKSGDTPMLDVWDQLPKDAERTNPQGVQELQIAGKWFGATTRTGHVALAIRHTIDKYGRRAKAAANTDGKDWKALSHALRVSYQCEDLMMNGAMTLPHPQKTADYLRQIKLGQVDIEEVRDQIDRSLADVEAIAAVSDLPAKVDTNWWDDWLAYKIEQHSFPPRMT